MVIMDFNFSRFHTIYNGTGVSYKIAKLSENRSYKVRLFASNDAGQGPYSQLYEFKTAYAHPPPLKGNIIYYIIYIKYYAS